MNEKIYYTTINTDGVYRQLNKLVIARITSGKIINNIEVYTPLQALSVQRLTNRLNHGKNGVIAYKNGVN